MLHLKALFEQLLLQVAPLDSLLVVYVFLVCDRVDILLIALILRHRSPSAMIARAQIPALNLSLWLRFVVLVCFVNFLLVDNGHVLELVLQTRLQAPVLDNVHGVDHAVDQVGQEVRVQLHRVE